MTRPGRALTIVEIAAFLGVTPGAVRKQIRRAGIKPLPVKFGRHTQYDSGTVLTVMGTHDRRVARTTVRTCGAGR